MSDLRVVDTSRRLAHLLVCTNHRQDPRMACCGDRGEAVYGALRQWVTQRRLLSRIWVTPTDCLGWCHADGATVVFYPDDIWYQGVTVEDCPELIARHLLPLVG